MIPRGYPKIRGGSKKGVPGGYPEGGSGGVSRVPGLAWPRARAGGSGRGGSGGGLRGGYPGGVSGTLFLGPPAGAKNHPRSCVEVFRGPAEQRSKVPPSRRYTQGDTRYQDAHYRAALRVSRKTRLPCRRTSSPACPPLSDALCILGTVRAIVPPVHITRGQGEFHSQPLVIGWSRGRRSPGVRPPRSARPYKKSNANLHSYGSTAFVKMAE